MFESGKKTTNKKPENQTGGEGCELPTVEQVLEFMDRHLVVLIEVSDTFDKVKSDAFKQDRVAYIKSCT